MITFAITAVTAVAITTIAAFTAVTFTAIAITAAAITIAIAITAVTTITVAISIIAATCITFWIDGNWIRFSGGLGRRRPSIPHNFSCDWMDYQFPRCVRSGGCDPDSSKQCSLDLNIVIPLIAQLGHCAICNRIGKNRLGHWQSHGKNKNKNNTFQHFETSFTLRR